MVPRPTDNGTGRDIRDRQRLNRHGCTHSTIAGVCGCPERTITAARVAARDACGGDAGPRAREMPQHRPNRALRQRVGTPSGARRSARSPGACAGPRSLLSTARCPPVVSRSLRSDAFSVLAKAPRNHRAIDLSFDRPTGGCPLRAPQVRGAGGRITRSGWACGGNRHGGTARYRRRATRPRSVRARASLRTWRTSFPSRNPVVSARARRQGGHRVGHWRFRRCQH